MNVAIIASLLFTWKQICMYTRLTCILQSVMWWWDLLSRHLPSTMNPSLQHWIVCVLTCQPSSRSHVRCLLSTLVLSS